MAVNTTQDKAPTIKERDNELTDNLRDTDWQVARDIVSTVNDYSRTDIESVLIRRYGEILKIRIIGEVILSYNDVCDIINNNIYTTKDIITFTSGNVDIKLSTR